MSDIPINQIVDVEISIAAGGASEGDFGLACIFGASNTLTPIERYQSFANMTEIGAVYPTNTEEWKQADIYFSQSPAPPELWIARWLKVAAAGYFNSANTTTALSALIGINAGSLNATINGVPHDIIGLDFTSVASWDDVALVIQDGLQAVATGGFTLATVEAVVTTFGVNFYITSGTTGLSSTVAACAAAASGTDITTLLNLRTGTSVAGAPAETPVQALQAVSAINDSYFGVLFTNELRDVDDVLTLSAYIESVDKTYFTVTQDVNVLNPSDTTSNAYKAKQSGYTQTLFCYTDIDQYMDASIMSTMFTVNFLGVATVKNPKFRSLPGIAAVSLTTSQLQALQGVNCNTAISVKGASFFSDGRMSGQVSGATYYFDTLHFVFWLQDYIATNMLNLFLSTNKVPYSDTGVQQEVLNLANSLQQGVVNGGLSPLLDPNNNNKTIPAYNIVLPAKVATIPSNQRNARTSPPLQFTANGSGAINRVTINGTVVQ
jgi:hypothetical protein